MNVFNNSQIMMLYRDYLQQMSFRWYRPRRYPKGFARLSMILKRFGVSFEVLNTKLPEGEAVMRKRLAELLAIPRLSTFAIGALINEGVSRLEADACFLNIGVWQGFSFLAGLKDHPQAICVGVDNFSEFGGPRDAILRRFAQYKSERHFFYDMDYQEYFRAIHHDKIGFYFYDGDHQYAHQMQGLQLAEPFLTPNAIILIDDTNREAPRQATLDFVAQSRFRYEILLDQPTCISDHPTFWDGVMVLQRMEK